MKTAKILAIVLCAVLLFSGCNSKVAYDPDTVLTYRLGDMDVQVQLSEEDARFVAGLFHDKQIQRWIDWDTWTLRYYAYGCPFDENVTIRIGETVYYIGYDGCGTVRIGNTGEAPHIRLSYEEDQQLVEIFRKYTGLERPY